MRFARDRELDQRWGGVSGTDNQQLGMDLGVPVEQIAWGKRTDPDRQAAQVQKFLDRGGLKSLRAEPWPKDAPELKAVNAVVVELFPDMGTAMSPENADMADAFICFLGAYAIKFCGARWYDENWFGREYSFYDVNSALEFGDHGESKFIVWGLMGNFVGQGFSSAAEMIRNFAEEHPKRGGTPRFHPTRGWLMPDAYDRSRAGFDNNQRGRTFENGAELFFAKPAPTAIPGTARLLGPCFAAKQTRRKGPARSGVTGVRPFQLDLPSHLYRKLATGTHIP